MKFYICKHCGNIITKINDSNVGVVCCGSKMEEMIPGTVDASLEKHIPVVVKEGNVVNVYVGEVPHPMIDVHYIEWIVLETTKGHQLKYLKPGEQPFAKFVLADDEEVVNCYEHCNIHGLWKK